MKRLRDNSDRIEAYAPPKADIREKTHNEWRQWQWRHVRELFVGCRDWVARMLPEQQRDAAADLAPLILRCVVDTIFCYDVRIELTGARLKPFDGFVLRVYGKESMLYRHFSFLPHYDELLVPVAEKEKTTYWFDECRWLDKDDSACPAVMAINSPANLGACLKRMRYPVPGDTEPLLRIKSSTQLLHEGIEGGSLFAIRRSTTTTSNK
jgi:hypothetical protein